MTPTTAPSDRAWKQVAWLLSLVAVAAVLWIAWAAGGSPDPLASGTGATSAVLDIGVLVFREGLECILVLSAITASMVGATRSHRKPIAIGVIAAAAATLLTWRIAIGVIDRLTESVSALQVQAATGLLAIVVLLVVMNWFFHKFYWAGWISLHTKRKRELTRAASDAAGDEDASSIPSAGIFWGFAALGFTSFYREGFEVVLFLQTYRLKLGGGAVLNGVLLGTALSGVVAVLTFLAQRRLPYRKMLVLTGVLLGVVLLIMVGEQAQEMQLAHWLPTTPIPSLERVIPAWAGLWLAVFPTVETLAAQLLAALLVLGSYTAVRVRVTRQVRQPA